MRKYFRSIQTFFPFLHDLRFKIKLLLIRVSGKPHEYDFTALKYFKPEPQQVYVDIGSNRGEAITSMLVMSKTKNRIIGFEPNSLIFSKLKKNFDGNNRIEVNNCGLGDKKQELTLYIPFYRKWMFDGLSSLKYEAAEDWLKTRLWRFNMKKLSIKRLSCEVRTLDEFNLNPYFIKIDVQGFEFEVLKGGENTIKTYKPILLIESISEEVIQYLKSFGYLFYSFKDNSFLEGTGGLNTFCMTQDQLSKLSVNH